MFPRLDSAICSINLLIKNLLSLTLAREKDGIQPVARDNSSTPRAKAKLPYQEQLTFEDIQREAEILRKKNISVLGKTEWNLEHFDFFVNPTLGFTSASSGIRTPKSITTGSHFIAELSDQLFVDSVLQVSPGVVMLAARDLADIQSGQP